MKTLINAVGVVVLFSVSSVTMAEQCPDNLNVDETYDCIVVKGADNDFKAIGTRKDEQAKSSHDSSIEQAMVGKAQAHAGL